MLKIILILSLISSNLFSQAKFYHFAENNFPKVQIYGFEIDSEDVLWIATTDGLLKFENDSWEFFDTSNSPIINNVSRGLAIDDNDNIWFSSSEPGQLVKYDRNNWQIWDTENSDIWNFSSGRMSFHPNGNLYIGSNIGLQIFNPQTEEFKQYFHLDYDLEGMSVFQVAFAKDGSAWIHNTQAVYNFKEGEFTELKRDNKSIRYYRRIAVDSSDNLWINDDSLMVYDGESWTDYNFDDLQAPGINVDDDGIIYFGVTGKLAYKVGNYWREYIIDLGRDDVDFNYFYRFDSKGNIWTIAMHDNRWGLVTYSPLINSVEIKDASPLKVSPNPSTSNISISGFDSGFYELHISDINSNILKSIFLERSNSSYSFDITDLPTGTYFIQMIGDSNYTGKFIKE